MLILNDNVLMPASRFIKFGVELVHYATFSDAYVDIPSDAHGFAIIFEFAQDLNAAPALIIPAGWDRREDTIISAAKTRVCTYVKNLTPADQGARVTFSAPRYRYKTLLIFDHPDYPGGWPATIYKTGAQFTTSSAAPLTVTVPNSPMVPYALAGLACAAPTTSYQDFSVFDKADPGTQKLGTLITNYYARVRWLINATPFNGNTWKFVLPGSAYSTIHYIMVGIGP